MSDLRKKSGILYLAFFLLIVCAVATALMAVAAQLTKKPIADKDAKQIAETLKQVVPPFTEQKVKKMKTDDGLEFDVYTVKNEGKKVGYAVKAYTMNGYGGRVDALVGFDAKGDILRVIVTGHNETPGIGTKVVNRSRVRKISEIVTGKTADTSLPPNEALDSYNGKNCMTPLAKEDVHFVSGATVSSSAMLKLVNSASSVLAKKFDAHSKADFTSSATSKEKKSGKEAE